MLTGDDELELHDWYELVEVVEAVDERRKDVRRPLGENRDRIIWNRECILLEGELILDGSCLV